ncbi:BCCT family transporter [Cucumibacter marinus]|uniref:BCCT family transporter n=1 Tax=Cucumibacter marinus TaxID=1121252 RepID=UPI0003FC7A76|nr:BCCT family transporter [Cucumibacter marinus]
MTENNQGDQADAEAIPAPEGPTEIIDTDYEVGQDNITPKVGPFGLDIHNPVFLISGATIVLFVVLTIAFQSSTEPMFTALRGWLTSTFDWFFLLAGNIFVLVALGILVSPLGKVRIGGKDAKPDFGYAGWFAMLFAAGMGIGLMFYGVLEPVYHMALSQPLGIPPLFDESGAIIEENVAIARSAGMAATIYHWALHPWAIYAIVALALAIFSYNKGLPLSVRSMFYPIFGERIWGWTGHIIDILAVFATLFGLATSLGIGAEQASAGLGFLFGMPDSNFAKVLLIIGITGIALLSVVAGLDAGVKRLSEINMVLAAVLLLFVILVGPTLGIITGFFQNLWGYARDIIPLSNPFGRTDDAFRQGWTSFYWAWWISWSPFVGMFIARVSRGRTVREFITCVLIIPSLVSVLWMSAFGGAAIDQVLTNSESAVREYVIDGYVLELSLFGMLSELPLAQITSFVAIILVIVFFVTSSDSGSLVIDTITAGGKVNAPVSQRVFWASFEGLVAIALLLGGGLTALQAMAVSTGFPFTIILLLACFAVIKGLMDEPR